MLKTFAALALSYIVGALFMVFAMTFIPPVGTWQVTNTGMSCLRQHFLSNQNYLWDLRGESEGRYHAVGGSPFGSYMPAKFAISFSTTDFHVPENAVVPFYGLIVADVERRNGEWISCDRTR